MSDKHNTTTHNNKNSQTGASKYFQIEEEILSYWKENDIFKKSLFETENRKEWNFLDGPPFVTGMPHYGHIIGSILKDVFPRFKTMQGYSVRRVWGWDCHGLPAENKVENALGLKSKKEIEEKVGIKKFIDECKLYVNNVSSEWEWYVDHIGRWVDFEHAYRTMDTNYMESVMWVFKQMYDKGYIYKGLRVSLYCPHCSTPISNFEVAMDANENYKEVIEPANTYKYKVKILNSLLSRQAGKFQVSSSTKEKTKTNLNSELGTRNSECGTYFLAWSTTPWTKLSTTALAVNPDLVYVVAQYNNENYIVAQTTLEQTFKSIGVELKDVKIIDKKLGKELIGIEYEPHFDYFDREEGKKLNVIVADEFVTADEGTGIVTIAPYGEEDLKVMKRDNIQIVLNVDDEGHFTKETPNGWGGMFYLKANKLINQNLTERGLMFHENAKHAHTVAFCWRCHERLIFKPQEAWYVDIQTLKPNLVKNNESVNWYPSHFKYGRFQKSMEGAPDWCISRSRYWGSPVPVWECECGERFVPGSISELSKKAGRQITDLHKPEIDEVTVKCDKCGKDAHRVSEVLDSWIEAGSASFAERHFPFESMENSNIMSDSSGFPPTKSNLAGLPNRMQKVRDIKEKLASFFPPDFISEYTGQIRAWFYVLHVISTAIYDTNAFKNVLVSGVILGTDGRKMSKNYKNYPDPKEVIEKYGGDALRLYLLGSPITKAEDIKISEAEYRDQLRLFIIPLLNIWNFVEMYSKTDGFDTNLKSFDLDIADFDNWNVLDKWLLTRLNTTIADVTEHLENFDTMSVVKTIIQFVDDWSRWHLRRSRDRIGAGDLEKDGEEFYKVTLHVFEKFLRLIAPIVPFHAEYLYKKITGKESVHLEKWPELIPDFNHDILETNMQITREICEIGHQIRKSNNQKVRTPLISLDVKIDKDVSKIHSNMWEVVLSELNIKNIVINNSFRYPEKEVIFTSEELEKEGRVRDLIREVQAIRKNIGLQVSDSIRLKAPVKDIELLTSLKKKLRITEILEGDKIEVAG